MENYRFIDIHFRAKMSDSFYEIPSVPQTRRPLGLDHDDTIGDKFFELCPSGSSPTPVINRSSAPTLSVQEDKEKGKGTHPIKKVAEPPRHSHNVPNETAKLPRRSRDSVPKTAELPRRANNAVSKATTDGVRTASVKPVVRRSASNIRKTSHHEAGQRLSATETKTIQGKSVQNFSKKLPVPTPITQEEKEKQLNKKVAILPRRSNNPVQKSATNVAPRPAIVSRPQSALAGTSNTAIRTKPIMRRSASIARNTAQDASQRRSALMPITSHPGQGKPATNFAKALRVYKTPTGNTPLRPATIPNTPQVMKRSHTHSCSTEGLVQGSANKNESSTSIPRPNSALAGTSNTSTSCTSNRRSEAFWERLSKPKHVTAKVITPQVKPNTVIKKPQISRIGVAGIPTPKINRSSTRRINQN